VVDTFTLVEQPSPLYFLPEESLQVLAGERAGGLWQLEIWDNRAGDTNVVTPILVSWQLTFVYENNVPIPGTLTHGQPVTNSIPPGAIAYFIVDVPAWASFATNRLLTATDPLNLWFNQTGPPATTNASDVLLFGPATSGSRTLATNGIPPLLPGQRYYLGVENPGTNTVTYAIQVDFDITPLEDGVPVSSTLAANGIPRYFSFDVTTNAQAVRFDLFNLTGNVQLAARWGAPLPTLSSFDYLSANPGVNDEVIIVDTNSLPVPLAPGRWYLGVFNVDTVAVDYTIQATEFTNALPNIITLTNAIPYFNTNTLLSGNADYYRFEVSTNAARAQFEINGPDGDVTLVVRKGMPLPDLFLYDYLSANGGTNDELIITFTNSAPVPLTPGEWFLTAINVSGGPVAYFIKATEWPVTGRPVIITNSYVTNGSYCLTWTSLPGVPYHVEGITQIGDTNWVAVSPTIVATDYFTTWCLPLPSPYHFFRVVEGGALGVVVPTAVPLTPWVAFTNSVLPGQMAYFSVDAPAWASFATNRLLIATDPLNLWFNQAGLPTGTNAGDATLFGPSTSGSSTLTTNGTPALLPGQMYFLALENPGTNPVSYVIQVDLDITPLADGVPVSSTLAVSGIPRYFSYDVTTNAQAVRFELFNLTGNVQLVARRDAPLPTLSSYDYRSANPGTNDEIIIVQTNSLPVSLTPGRWYLGVFNVDTVAVDYTIQATEFTNVPPVIITLTNAVPYANTNFFAPSDVDYYRFVVSTNAVRAQFEINAPTADLTLVARKGLPLPDLATHDFLSANPGLNDELIVFHNYSAPVALTPGEWFLTAVNVAGVPAAYSIMATEWPVHGTNIAVILQQVVSNQFCITWTSLPGAHYVVEGKPDLNATNWTDVSPTLTATGPETTWCIPLPSVYHFFRVREGLSLGAAVTPVAISRVVVTGGGVELGWVSPTNQTFRVQWSPAIAPAVWTDITNIVASTNTTFTFTDDGSQTGGLGVTRFYRLVIQP
jgi:hypothetical protein